MTRRIRFKIAVDILMTVILLLLMAFSLIGEAAHEWLGAGMLLLFILHHIFNFEWIKQLGTGRYSAYRIFQTILVALILLTMLGSMISGIVLSRYVFSFLPIRGGRSLARIVHMLCAYWGFLFMSLHLGLHWGMINEMLRRMLDIAPSPIRSVILRMVAILIAIYGAVAFYRNDILSYLLLRTHFVFFDFDQPLALFFTDYLAMMGLFVFIAYYASRLLRRKHIPKKQKNKG